MEHNALQLTATPKFEPAGLQAAAAGETPKLPRFSLVAYTGAVINQAWGAPVVVDMAGIELPTAQLPIHWNHNQDDPVGYANPDQVRIEKGELLVSGVISSTEKAALNIINQARNGRDWQASIGASVLRREFVEPGTNVNVNGQDLSGPLYIVRAAALREVSFCSVGADGATTATVAARKPHGEVVRMENEKVVQATQAQGSPAPAQPAVQAAAPDAGVQASRQTSAAELRRQDAILKACGDNKALAAKAIEDGWTAERAELEVLRASRPTAPAILVARDQAGPQVLEAACALTGNLADPEKSYPEQTLEAARKRFRGGIGLQELLLEAAWANGYTGRAFRVDREVLRCAFSSRDISGVLSNIANKFLLAGFMGVEDTWRRVAAINSVRDFKTVTRYRLTGNLEYELVAPGGEIKHGTLADENYTNKADTYASMLAVTREDIVNDDLNALTAVPRMLGRGSALKLNKVFWTEFLADNNSFYTAGRSNYISGAGTVLGVDGLIAGEVAFAAIVDADGNPTGLVPVILLVPKGLGPTARQLMKSTEIRDTNSSTKYGTANPVAGKYTVEESAYLNSSAISGGSATAWFLMADPQAVPAIEVVFLNGQEAPTVETVEMEANVLGVQMRGYHDFGVKKQDHRAALKSKGAA